MNINFLRTLKNKFWIFVRWANIKSNEQILSKYSSKSTKNTAISFLVILKVTPAGKLFLCDITVINGQWNNLVLKEKKDLYEDI